MAYETAHKKIRGDKITMCQIYKHRDDKQTTGLWHYRFRFDNKTMRRSSKEKDFAKACIVAEDHYDGLRFKKMHNLPTSEKTFKEVYDLWWEAIGKTLSISRQTAFKTASGNYFLPHFGKMKIDSLTTAKMPAYIKWRVANYKKRPPSAQTLKMEKQQLLQILDWTVENKFLDQAPKIVLPASVGTRPNKRMSFSEADLIIITNKANAFVQDGNNKMNIQRRAIFISFLMFSLNSGMRIGEVRHLKWKHVRTKDGHVTIDLPEFKEVNGKQERHKTGKRTIVCLPEITQWIRLRKQEVKKFQGDEDFLFPTKNGGTANFDVLFNTFMKYCDTVAHPNGSKYTIYSTRHTYATGRV
ncbi:MAG: tyrosine-type recombinase/integrase, partial [Alphaproteobacteria bacterium]